MYMGGLRKGKPDFSYDRRSLSGDGGLFKAESKRYTMQFDLIK
jgi:hypothetical protein